MENQALNQTQSTEKNDQANLGLNVSTDMDDSIQKDLNEAHKDKKKNKMRVHSEAIRESYIDNEGNGTPEIEDMNQSLKIPSNQPMAT